MEFDRPIGLFEFIRLKLDLEELSGREVDLVTPDALRDSMRSQILEEAIYDHGLQRKSLIKIVLPL